VDVEGQLGKLAIDQLYNQKFKKILYYRWVKSFIIRKCNLDSHKKSKFDLAQKICNMLYTSITNQNLVWDDFE
jgi:hypothetical protein